jgi:hypothetical protein
LMVIQNACPRFSDITLLSVIVPLAQAWKSGETSLLDATPLEKSGVGRVLLDIGGLALLGRVLNVFVPLRAVLVHFGMVAGTLGAAIAGRYRRHFVVTRHLDLPGVRGVLVR